MIRTLTATSEVRVRRAVVATLLVLTFVTGIGAGLGLAQVTAGPVANQATIRAFAGSGTDMSSVAYSAAHQAAIHASTGSGSDMSAAAYDAAHQAAIDARSGSDMSAAAYDAAHQAAIDAQSGAQSH